MVDTQHLTDREQIIYFFVKTSANKLNKNHYNINFYKKRKSVFIFEKLLNYFNDIPNLVNENLSLKYYHIYNLDSPVLKKSDFINFSSGYAGIVKEQVKVERDLVHRVPIYAMYSKDKTVELIHKILFDKHGCLVSWINDANKIRDKILIASIFHHANNNTLPFKHCIKILTENVSIEDMLCACGTPKDIFQFKLRDTCGKLVCRKSSLSRKSKERGSYKSFLSESARAKKSASLIGRVFTEAHKESIRAAKKQQYTPEYIAQDRQMRIDKGIYKKCAETLRQKILNGEYTPKNNRIRAARIPSKDLNTSYRSRWEEKFHTAHPNLKFEYTRIAYEHENKQHVYIVDFTDVDNRIIYEIKPKQLLSDSMTQSKISAALDWCTCNNYTYKIVTEDDFNFYDK
jgi:hypothetical protein